MAKEAVQSVTFVGSGEKKQFALVSDDKGGGNLDVIAWDGNSWQLHKDVPRRDPKDYDEKGGGVTWH